ncbi:hypothetical protein RS130_15475 [Paraglaciecola aquimarina]|uniref:CBM6 domain-containing protein n=1 Tax=Paraglaciecola aquimarina TaxID=1235557 RepID=A0ABU3SYN2_9ALTE|nr:hypothetical protein [Paraglaciecola aquimarina]MDU0355113.1 hypothetical protein [Paraglaciecola aquimarina]
MCLSADLFASGNPSFDDGLDQTKFNIRDPAIYGSQQNAAETIEVREGDDTIDGKSLFIDNTAGAARMTILANATSQSGVKPGDYNLMFDYKVLSGVLNVAMAPNGGNWRPWPNWGQSKPAGDQGTATVKIENYLIGNDGKFHIIFNIDQIEGQGGTHYLDNFRLVPIE